MSESCRCHVNPYLQDLDLMKAEGVRSILSFAAISPVPERVSSDFRWSSGPALDLEPGFPVGVPSGG